MYEFQWASVTRMVWWKARKSVWGCRFVTVTQTELRMQWL